MDNAALFPSDAAGTPRYPLPGAFSYPPNPLAYTLAYTANFPNNVPGTPLLQARPGDIYAVHENSFSGSGFGWLTWNGDTDSLALAASLSDPWLVETYVNPFVPYDDELSTGDWVAGFTGNLNSTDVREALKPYIDAEPPRLLRVVFFEGWVGSGANHNYRADGFALVRLHGYGYGTSDKWLLLEFLGWSEPCPPQMVAQPPPGSHGAAAGSSITLDYNRPISATSVHSSSIVAHGAHNGRLEGTYLVSGGTVTFTPTHPLHPGERVQVSATTATHGSSQPSSRAGALCFCPSAGYGGVREGSVATRLLPLQTKTVQPISQTAASSSFSSWRCARYVSSSIVPAS